MVGALPFGLAFQLGILRVKMLPAGLHGVLGFRIAEQALRSLRSAFVSAVCPRSISLANAGAVLSLLDGPVGCDPASYVFLAWFQ